MIAGPNHNDPRSLCGWPERCIRARWIAAPDHVWAEGEPQWHGDVMALFLKPLIGFIVSTGIVTSLLVLFSHAG